MSTSNANGWDTRYEFKAVLMMSLAFGLVGLDRFILLPLLPAISADLGLNYTQGNALVSALAVAWGVAAIFAGATCPTIWAGARCSCLRSRCSR
jgi:predicted MFS family arabinose efflux permease